MVVVAHMEPASYRAAGHGFADETRSVRWQPAVGMHEDQDVGGRGAGAAVELQAPARRSRVRGRLRSVLWDSEISDLAGRGPGGREPPTRRLTTIRRRI